MCDVLVNSKRGIHPIHAVSNPIHAVSIQPVIRVGTVKVGGTAPASVAITTILTEIVIMNVKMVMWTITIWVVQIASDLAVALVIDPANKNWAIQKMDFKTEKLHMLGFKTELTTETWCLQPSPE